MGAQYAQRSNVRHFRIALKFSKSARFPLKHFWFWSWGSLISQTYPNTIGFFCGNFRQLRKNHQWGNNSVKIWQKWDHRHQLYESTEVKLHFNILKRQWTHLFPGHLGEKTTSETEFVSGRLSGSDVTPCITICRLSPISGRHGATSLWRCVAGGASQLGTLEVGRVGWEFSTVRLVAPIKWLCRHKGNPPPPKNARNIQV